MNHLVQPYKSDKNQHLMTVKRGDLHPDGLDL